MCRTCVCKHVRCVCTHAQSYHFIDFAIVDDVLRALQALERHLVPGEEETVLVEACNRNDGRRVQPLQANGQDVAMAAHEKLPVAATAASAADAVAAVVVMTDATVGEKNVGKSGQT